MIPSHDKIVPYFSFTDGINTVASEFNMKPSEFRDAQDIDLYPMGGFSKRKPDRSIFVSSGGDANKAILGIFGAQFSDGTVNVFFICNTNIYQINVNTQVNSTITGGLTITYGVHNFWYFDILNDIICGANGIDTPIQITETPTATNISGMPFTNYVFPVQYRGYMFFFKPTVSGVFMPNRCYFSNVNDPTTSGANNFIDIGKGAGGAIQGAIVYGTYLYVWTTNGIYQISYSPTAIDSAGDLFPFTQNPNPIITGVGTLSHRSISKFTTPITHPTPGVEYVGFVDQFGNPRIFDGVTTINLNLKIGYSTDSTILTLSNMDKTQTAFNHSKNFPQYNRLKFWMSSGSSSGNEDVTWVLDYNYGFSMMRYNYDVPFNVCDLAIKSNGKYRQYGGSSTGIIKELDYDDTSTFAGDDQGATNDYALVAGIYGANPILQSKFHQLEMRGLNASSQSFNTPPSGPATKLSYFMDGITAAFFTDTLSLVPPSGTTSTYPINMTDEIRQVGKTLKIKIESNNKTNDFMIIEGFNLVIEPMGLSQLSSR